MATFYGLQKYTTILVEKEYLDDKYQPSHNYYSLGIHGQPLLEGWFLKKYPVKNYKK